MLRRRFTLKLCVLLTGASIFNLGCTTPLWDFRTPKGDNLENTVNKIEADDKSPKTVGVYTIPTGLGWSKVESISLATGLNGKGSDPVPSPQRAQLIQEMLARDTHRPEDKLASLDTSMVIAVAHLPPGVQKGDLVDVLVTTRGRSETTSLEGGFLFLSRMRPTEVLGNAVRTGSVTALAQGGIVTDATFDGDADPIRLKRGRILAGARSNISRPLGLRVRNKFESVAASTTIAGAVNLRFHFSDPNTGKRGVANPKSENYIELHVPKNYRSNMGRYLRVVAHIMVNESASDRARRMAELRTQLLDPETSEDAALALEAIGKESISTLTAALDSANSEVRFFAAEALAYFDQKQAIPHLERTAVESSFYRWRALTAITQMHHLDAAEALANMLHSTSAETRYGAFTSLRENSPGDPLVRGKTMNQEFYLHVVPTTGDSFVHINRFRRPEVVIFDNGSQLENFDYLMVKNIILKADESGDIRVSRFEVGKDDRRVTCSPRLPDVVAAIVKVGGSYSDVYRIFKQAQDRNVLGARLEINAMPQPKGEKRAEEETLASAPSDEDWSDNPFFEGDSEEIEPENRKVTTTDPEPEPGILDRMTGWILN